MLRDDIKENPVKSGFFQIGGCGESRGPPDPDFLHVDENVNPDFEGGDSESGITELKVFEHSFCWKQLDQVNNQWWPSVS